MICAGCQLSGFHGRACQAWVNKPSCICGEERRRPPVGAPCELCGSNAATPQLAYQYVALEKGDSLRPRKQSVDVASVSLLCSPDDGQRMLQLQLQKGVTYRLTITLRPVEGEALATLLAHGLAGSVMVDELVIHTMDESIGFSLWSDSVQWFDVPELGHFVATLRLQ